MIVFEKLWKKMREKGVSQYMLIHHYGISPAQITRLKKNSSVTTHTLNKFCELLDCDIHEIAEYIKE